LKTLDALVIGAGPAGLTTAYSLAKAGRSVLVIEQDPLIAGVVRFWDDRLRFQKLVDSNRHPPELWI